MKDGHVYFCFDCVVWDILLLVAYGYYPVFSESYKLVTFK